MKQLCTHYVRIFGLAAASGVFPLAGTGCTSSSPTAPGSGEPQYEFAAALLPAASVRQVSADWLDLDASVGYAVGMVEMAVVSQNDPSLEPRVFLVRTIRDEPGRLEVARVDTEVAAKSPRPVDLTMRCSIGRFGHPARERALLDAVAKRLAELRAVDYAPLPD